MMRLFLTEARKLRTIWSTYVLAGIVVLLDIAFGLLVAFAPGGKHGGTAGIVPHGSSLWFTDVFSVLDNSRLFALVLGILVITGEYRYKTVTPTFLAEPRRGWVVTSKLAVVFVAGLGLGILTMLTGLLIGLLLVGLKIQSCLTFGGVQQGASRAMCTAQHGLYFVANTHDLWHEWWRIAPGVAVGTALFAIYGLGLGALVKNQIVGLVIGLGFTLVVEPIIGFVWPTPAEYLPGQAATALEDAAHRTFGGGTNQLLPWWGGALVVVAYAVILSLVGTFTTLRSDVT